MVTAKNKKSQIKSPKQPKSPKRHNKSHTKTSSTKVHTVRTRLSRRSRLSERDRKLFLVSKRAILTIIVLAMLVVILAVLASIFSNPEALVKSKIESITADYYESYFYPRIETYGTTDKSLADIMSRYTETGFSKVTLRQLLLFDSERYASSTAFLSEYCDIESTYVKIYPEPPYTKSDYRTEYHYTCTF